MLSAVNRPSLSQTLNQIMNRTSEIGDLLDVFRATGMRKPQGSATEFNRQMSADLADGSLTGAALDAARTGGLSFLSRVKEQGQRAWLGRNTNRLADLFTARDSVGQIRALLARQAETPGGQVFVRQLFQIGGAVGQQ